MTPSITFERNTYIYREGDTPKYLYFIKRGQVDVRPLP